MVVETQNIGSECLRLPWGRGGVAGWALPFACAVLFLECMQSVFQQFVVTGHARTRGFKFVIHLRAF